MKYWLNFLKQEEMQIVMFLTYNFKLVHLNWKLRILTLFYVLVNYSNLFYLKRNFMFHIVMKLDITKDRIWFQVDKKMGIFGMKRDADCVKVSSYIV